jgi:hypothetical protein
MVIQRCDNPVFEMIVECGWTVHLRLGTRLPSAKGVGNTSDHGIGMKNAKPVDKPARGNILPPLLTLEVVEMATGKRKVAKKLRWRSKKANHGKKPCTGR